MSNLYDHGFSDETPIEEIAKSFLGIDINGKKLKELLPEIALIYDNVYHNLGATTAIFGSHRLYLRYSYIVRRIIDLYTTDEDLKNKIKYSYDKYVTTLKDKRHAKNNLKDDAMTNYKFNETKSKKSK